jgi:TRAP-type C4-dicarboxylate transport system permease small subunit
MTQRLLELFGSISRVGVWLGGIAFIVVSFIVTVEVILRKVFLIGLSVATELSAYTLAVASAWAFSFALLQRAHVRVDAGVRLLPRRAVLWVDVLALLALTWFAGMLVWHGAGVFGWSVKVRALAMTPLQTPMWIPQGLWLLGLVLFLLTCLAVLARSLALVAVGQEREASAIIGTFSTEEEAAYEAREAEKRRRELVRIQDKEAGP